jgi:hypothetical protein
LLTTKAENETNDDREIDVGVIVARQETNAERPTSNVQRRKQRRSDRNTIVKGAIAFATTKRIVSISATASPARTNAAIGRRSWRSRFRQSR